MSWLIFRKNVLNILSEKNPSTPSGQIASLIAKEYDFAMKRGRSFLNGESIARGNLQIMENYFESVFKSGLATLNDTFPLLNLLGVGIKAYWQGASMNPFPIPVIPVPGSIQYLQVTSNTVINSGIWPIYPPIEPNTDTSLFVDRFILASAIHLITLQGLIQGISLYPSTPTPIPGISIQPWTAYFVSPSTQASQPPDETNFVLSEASDDQSLEIEASTGVITDTNSTSNDITAFLLLLDKSLPDEIKTNDKLQFEKNLLANKALTEANFKCA